LVPGFTLRWGFWSALVGSLTLAIVISILLSIVRTAV
jgi:putative membrane protein